MLNTSWLRALPRHVFGHGRRASVQVGVCLSSSDMVAARVRRDPDGSYAIERVVAAQLKTQRDDQAVAQLIGTGILRNAQVMLVLGSENYSTYPLPCPSVPSAEVREALRWKLREVLPYGPEDAVIDFVQLARADSSAAETLFAVAAPRRSVAHAVAPFDAAGIEVQAVDIAEMAQRNVLEQLPGAEAGRALLGLDAKSALLTVVEQDVLCFARRIQIPRSLATEDEEDPEHVAVRIATQVQRSLEVVERQSGLAPIRTVWIGPHPYAALIARCTGERTGMECLQLDLQAELRFEGSAFELAAEQAPAALIAIGAALRDEQTAAGSRSGLESPALSWLSRLNVA